MLQTLYIDKQLLLQEQVAKLRQTLKGGSTISLDVASLLKSLSAVELDDLVNKLIYAGYASSADTGELFSAVSLFIDDKNLDLIKSKEDLWSELINHGYKLGDRILNFNFEFLKC